MHKPITAAQLIDFLLDYPDATPVYLSVHNIMTEVTDMFDNHGHPVIESELLEKVFSNPKN